MKKTSKVTMYCVPSVSGVSTRVVKDALPTGWQKTSYAIPGFPKKTPAALQLPPVMRSIFVDSKSSDTRGGSGCVSVEAHCRLSEGGGGTGVHDAIAELLRLDTEELEMVEDVGMIEVVETMDEVGIVDDVERTDDVERVDDVD